MKYTCNDCHFSGDEHDFASGSPTMEAPQCPECYSIEVTAGDDPDKLRPCPTPDDLGLLVCPDCKHNEFRYVEDISCWRTVLLASEGNLRIDGLYKTSGYDDGENGRLQCANCCAEFALPESLELSFE